MHDLGIYVRHNGHPEKHSNHAVHRIFQSQSESDHLHRPVHP